jgi:nicotinate phosphoribosyltransferase
MTCACGSYRSGPLALHDAALCTDLYELTMAASYHREGMQADATFSLFVRALPRHRSFLVAAGLADALAFLEQLEFSDAALAYLSQLGRFAPDFLAALAGLRFTGSVRAVPEGTLVFPDEPLLEVTAPLPQAQLVETALMNIVHLQTLLASKAARCVLAARGRAVVDFGLRRAHGLEAGLRAARCAYLAGAEASSNVLAGLVHGVPSAGTMAHAYVEAFASELEAFRAFARAFPASTTLLVDTYDTVAGTHKAVIVAQEMAARGERLAAVRLDSGDLVALSRRVRAILDAAGLTGVRILASGGLDEDEVERCVAAGAPIDAFGVGTRMDVSADAPALDMAYKLVRYDGRDVLKLSEGKKTWIGEKQVYRLRDAQGRLAGDCVALRRESPPAGSAEPLLATVMVDGRIVGSPPTLAAIRTHCAEQLAALPAAVRRLRDADRHPVTYGAALVALQHRLEAEAEATEVLPYRQQEVPS